MATPARARRIAHFDLDTFFVAVERVHDPSLVGRPVLVGHPGGRGVVASASYESRAYGCHSAQPMSQALRLCPQAIVVPPHFESYIEFSQRFHAILGEVAPVVESVGLDEAYADLTGVGGETNGASTAAAEVRRRVRDEIGIAVSVCIAGSRTVAKVGSDRAKPDGMIEVPAGTDAEFLAPLPIRDLPLVGPKFGEALARAGVRTIGHAAALDPRWLASEFGAAGEALAERARGIDPTPVVGGRERRGISRENTFHEDVTDLATLRRTLRRHAERVGTDLRAHGKRARTVSIKVRWHDFTTLSRSHTPSRPVHSTESIVRAALALFDEIVATEGLRPVRLLGVGVSNPADDEMQLALDDLDLAASTPRVLRREELDRAIDALREKYGHGTVTRGL